MSDSYYQFYVGDYQRDTGDLTLVEHGAYRVLLDYYYVNGSLPLDRERCLRIARAFTQEEVEAVDTVLARFFQIVDGAYRNKRADLEIERRKTFIINMSERGRKGAEARWNKGNMAQAMPKPMLEQCLDDGIPSPSPSPSPDPSPSPSPTEEEKMEGVYTPSSMTLEESDEENEEIMTHPPTRNGNCPHEEVISLYHEILPMLPRVRVWPETNKRLLRARWNEDAERQCLGWWREYFTYVRGSPFLTGQEKDWAANLEWLIRPRNMAKVLNGSYHKQKYGGIKAWLSKNNSNVLQEGRENLGWISETKKSSPG